VEVTINVVLLVITLNDLAFYQILGERMADVNDCISFQWFWQSDDNPWSSKGEAEFTAYSSDINQTIELAYLNHKSEVVINELYKIDFTNRMQISLNDVHSRRPIIRRELGLPSRIKTNSRNNQRFQHSAVAIRSFNVDTEFRGCDFIVDWYKWITNGKLKLDKSTIVDLAIHGILTEAQLYSDKGKATEDADCFIKELRKVQHGKPLSIIQEVCVQIYTEDSFLYRIINETLRDNNRTKFETLGPFCYLLYNYTGSSKNKQGKLPEKIVLYRGEPLSLEAIEEYKSASSSDTVWRWTQFVSTSKQRSVAEEFSNGHSLYIIEMKKRSASDQGVCIASLSKFAVEDEVLLRPGIRFKIMKIEEESSKRHLFYIDIIPSYMSGLN
jgi:hypothetical protein